MTFSEKELLQIYEISPRFVAIHKALANYLPVDRAITEWGFELVEIHNATQSLDQKIEELTATLAYGEFAADASNREFGYSVDVEKAKQRAAMATTCVQPLFRDFLPALPEQVAKRLPNGYLTAGYAEFKKLQENLETLNQQKATLRNTIIYIQQSLAQFDEMAGREQQSIHPLELEDNSQSSSDLY